MWVRSIVPVVALFGLAVAAAPVDAATLPSVVLVNHIEEDDPDDPNSPLRARRRHRRHLSEQWPQAYVTGTQVASVLDGVWHTGQVTSFSNGVYTVTWNNGTVENYNQEDVKQMVSNMIDRQGKDTDAYVDGTQVVKKKDGVWIQGAITHSDDGENYTVIWNDGSSDTYSKDTIEGMLAVVDHGSSNGSGGGVGGGNSSSSSKHKHIWVKGTAVAKKFDGKWHTGAVEDYENGEYTIQWDDGSEETYSLDETNEMVQIVVDAWEKKHGDLSGQTNQKKSSFVQDYLLFLIGGVGGMVVFLFGYGMYSQKQKEKPKKGKRKKRGLPSDANLHLDQEFDFKDTQFS